MPNFQPKIRHDEALAMYDAGAKDSEIAARFDADPSAIVRWRGRHGLPSKHVTRPVPVEKLGLARKMLRDGATKQQVADAIGVHPFTIRKLRRSMSAAGLRKAGQRQSSIRKAILRDPSIYPRILRAVGAGLPRDVKHDAANELYVDVLSGKLSADLIEARAPRYRNWAWNMCGSNYGPVSLDAANDDDFSLGDTIEDPAALIAMDEAAGRAWGQGKMLR